MVGNGGRRTGDGPHPDPLPKGEGESKTALSGVYPLYAIAFIVQLGMGIVGPILPDIMHDFSLAAWQAGMVVTMFGFARLLVDLPLGFLLDRVNRTTVLAIGTSLIVLGSVASGMSQDYSFLLAARLVMGVGSALSTVTALFSLSKASGAGSRGKTIGIYQAAMVGGGTFSPALGGFAAAIGGWRASFFFCGFTGFVALLLVILASGRGSLRLAPTKGERKAEATSEGGRGMPWDLIAIDFTTFVFFFSVQGFRNSMVPVFGGTELGMGAGTLGLLLGGSAAIRFVVTLVSGYLSDRHGRKAILIPGTMLLAAGTLGFLLVREPAGFVISLAILSLGGFGNSVPTTMVVDCVGSGRVGLAISVNRFIGDAGVLAGPVMLGFVLDTLGFQSVAVATAAILLATIPGIALAVQENPPRRVAQT